MHVAGANKPGHSGDGGAALHALLRAPTDICKDPSGNLYIADGGPTGFVNDACIRRVDAVTGIITTIAGVISADSASSSADNIPAISAILAGCAAICIDTQKNLLIADGSSCIRKVDMKTGIITTIAGSRTVKGYMGDDSAATNALLNAPSDIAVDAANNIYIADKNNNVIRKIVALTGKIYTIAGRNAKGFAGDGALAINAKLNNPTGIELDNAGNLFIADYGNNRVRKVSASGTITTVAGNGLPAFGGDGGKADTAKLNQPVKVITDNDGNLYISDLSNQRIRKVTPAGNISTYAGDGKNITSIDSKGDDGPAISASILPYGLEFDDCGNLYVGSALYSVRVITPTKPLSGILCGALVNSVADVAGNALQTLQVFPNPANGTFSLQLTDAQQQQMQVTITDMTGRTILQQSGTTNKTYDVALNAPAGLYFVTVATANGSHTAKLILN